jgi:nitrogen fixation/metabolism regulation signal transduction histidine kinase
MDKKIKLPQHLQLDSVSPATRLLEKRRAMYEVQKAFEDQKEEFKKKEENFKKRESELREKDTLIQDHLIKFSTFLQSHEMRRKKDAELHKIEEEKIKEKKDEVGKGSDKSTYLLKEAKKIETKVQYMQKFETFLEKVKEQHPDEFQELNDILSRYQTLKSSNMKLQKE